MTADIPNNLHQLLTNLANLHGHDEKKFVQLRVIEALSLQLQADLETHFLVNRDRIREVYKLNGNVEVSGASGTGEYKYLNVKVHKKAQG